MIRKEAGEEEEGILKNKSKNYERKTTTKNLFELEPMHKPLQAIESNTLSNGTEYSEEEAFKL